MCGIAGYMDLTGRRRAETDILDAMLGELGHRGPDGTGRFVDGPIAMGVQRLAIIDPTGSQQPLCDEAGDIVLVGNGEVFNFLELRKELAARGHSFRTSGDLEVVPHLFQDTGIAGIDALNGQFSLALFDRPHAELHLVRDRFGVTPLHYGIFDNTLVFASEIKAMLRHPLVQRRIDLIGLDQLLCFPGIVSPRTMFKGISALPPGHRLTAGGGRVESQAYWDLDYPSIASAPACPPERQLIEQFSRLLRDSVRLRMRSSRPVGVYLSGGIDSSMIAMAMRDASPSGDISSFSVVFPDSPGINEQRYQRQIAATFGLRHHEVVFRPEDIGSRLRSVVWHAESPLKESYNACTMALAEAAHSHGVPVVLCGEGADELLGGYPGYRFDQFAPLGQPTDSLEAAMNERLWGAAEIRYERQYGKFSQWRRQFFSAHALEQLGDLGCLAGPVVDPGRLAGRHVLHQRSYIDSKLRLADHLLGDHGDRMNMAHSVEGRYPFLDLHLAAFLADVPPTLKLRGLEEKYLLKEAARGSLPEQVRNREKFGFRAHASPSILDLQIPWVEELLSPQMLERQGILNVGWVTSAVSSYKAAQRFNPHLEDDVVLLALTLGIFMDLFEMSGL